MINVKKYYQNRFSDAENKQRNIVWQTLSQFWLQRYIKKVDTVMDFGAGYCEFLNNIECREKIAIDINPDTLKKANKGIKVLQVDVLSIPRELEGKIDVIFMSNFLEHLRSKEEVIKVLEKANKLLKKNGRVLILQPNIDLIKESYWDFIDHNIPLNTKSLTEALNITGFDVKELREKFLPYTSKNRVQEFISYSLPSFQASLIKLYLKLPAFLRVAAGQSFILAFKKV